MPQYKVQIPGQGTFDVESPTELTDEQAYMAAVQSLQPKLPEKLKEEPTVGGQIKEFAKGVIPGAVGMGQTALTGISALLPDEQERAARQYIDRGAAALKAPFAAAPGYEDTVGRKFGEAAGSILPFIATGPFGMAGRAAMVGMGVGAGAGEARIRAEQEGATPEQRSTATALGTIPGAFEVFAPMQILGRLADPIKQGIMASVKRALVAGGEEAAQEAASQIAQNLIAKGVYKPSQDIIEQVGESAAYGGATGALVQGILDMAIGRRAKPGPKEPSAGQPVGQPMAVPTAEGAIPEPTIKGATEEAPPETPEEIATKPDKAAKKLAAEQKAFLAQYEEQQAQREAERAEYERVKALSPEEYAAEQAGGIKVPAKKAEKPPADETGYYTQYPKPPTDTEAYAAQQIALAKDREPDANVSTYLDYLMQDPAQARALLANRTPIPGVTAKQSEALLGGIKMQLKARDTAAAKAETERVSTAQERARGLFEAQAKPEDFMGAAREQEGVQAQAIVKPEREALLRIGNRPNPYLTAARDVEQQRRDAEIVDKLVDTLPKDQGEVTQSQVYMGLGYRKQNTRDLQAQLAVARMTGNRDLQQQIKRELDKERPLASEGVLGTEGGKTAAEFISRSKVTDSRAAEVEGDKYAAEQRSTMLGMARLLQSKKIMLPGKREQLLSDAKETYIAQHAAEIEARRKAFGLPPMEDWERAEARARALEGLNTLTNNWGQFEDPVISVKALQNITRTAVYDNLAKAAERKAQPKAEQEKPTPKGTRYVTEGGKEMFVPDDKGPRIAAPDELTLKGEPRRKETDKENAIDTIDMVLRSVERRTRAEPVVSKRPPTKVGSMAALAELFEAAEDTGRSAKTDAGSVELLQRLRDQLQTNNDPEFVSLATETATRIAEGNVPNAFDVRDLGEMMAQHEEAGRSTTRPGATQEELQRTSAQPQKELFPEAAVQVQRATPSNFQKMLDSKDIQGLRDAIEQQRKENLTVLQTVGKAIPTLTNRLNQAKATYERKLKIAQKQVPAAKAFKKEFDEDLGVAQQALVEWQSQQRKIQRALADIDTVKEALLKEPSDMRFLINANKVLGQEPAFRKQLKQADTAVQNLENLLASINATNEANQTLIKPAQRLAEKADKERLAAQEELSAIKNEVNAQEQMQKRMDEREKAAKEKAERIIGTPDEQFKAAQQAGREGLGLPGERIQRETLALKDKVDGLRSAMGSLADQAARAKTDKQREKIQKKYDEKEKELYQLPEQAVVKRTGIAENNKPTAVDIAYEQERERLSREQNEILQLATTLPNRRVGPTVKDIKTGRSSQAGTRKEVIGSTQAVTDALVQRRAELDELNRRKTYLETNSKSVPRKLTAAINKAEKAVNQARREQNRVATEELATREALKTLQGRRIATEAKRATEAGEDFQFARGVETTSPDLTVSQVNALENNDIQQAMRDLAEGDNSQLNKVVAARLAVMLDQTDVKVQNKVTDANGKSVLGAATSKLVQLNRNGGLSQEILLHEGTHAATERVIVQYETDPSKLSEIQRVAVRELKALHAAIKNDPSITSASAKGDLSEFVAEVFSNRNLQEQLRNKKWRLSDAWKGFKSIIMRMLGVKDPETMLGAALQSVDALMIPSSERMGGKETSRSRRLSAKDIAALHTGSNSMQQFAEQFGVDIKQKDRTAEDAERIGQNYLNDMAVNTADYLPEAVNLTYDTRLEDGREYNPKNMADYFEATPQTIMNYEAKNNAELRANEAATLNEKRTEGLRSLVNDLREHPEYTSVEQALVAKAASKFAIMSDANGRLRLAELSKTNRHPVAIVGVKDAGYVIQELRAGKNIKAAFLDGLQKNADENAQKNKSKNGWKKFDQSDSYSDAEKLNAGAAGTSWCTGNNIANAEDQITKGDFYIHYKNGRPEVAIRMDGQTRINELRGNTPNQSLTPEQLKIAREFLNTKTFENSSMFINMMERKKALAEAFKNDTPLPVEHLYTGGDWVNTKSVGTTGVKISVTNSSVWSFTNFSEIDGELDAYRPQKPRSFDRLVKDKLTESLTTAIDNNEFPGVNLAFYNTDKIKVDLDRTQYPYNKVREVKLEDIKGVSGLTLDGTNVNLSNLKKIDELFVFGDTKVDLPNIQKLNFVHTYATKNNTEINLPKGSTVNRVVAFHASSDTGAHYLTIKGAETVNQVDPGQTSAFILNLPDAKYAPEPEFSFDRAMSEARGHANDALIYWTRTNNVNDAFVRYNRDNAERPGDEAKVERVAIQALKFAEDLVGKTQAMRLFKQSQYTASVGIQPEPIRFGVLARPALMRPLPVEIPRGAFTAQYARVVSNLAQELDAPPSDEQILARLQDLRDEYDQEVAARNAPDRARTLRLSEQQQYLLDFSGKKFATDEDKVEYLEKYYKNNSPIEQIKFDLHEVVIQAAEHYFAEGRDTRTDLRTHFLSKADKFNNVFGLSKEDGLRTTPDVINAPNKIVNKPKVEESEDMEEAPRYARAQAAGFEDVLATADQLIAKPATIRQRAEANLGLGFRTQVLDRLAPLEKVANEMLDPLRGMQMVYYLRMADQKMSFVQQAAGRGVPQIMEYTRKDGQKERLIESVDGPSLADVVDTLKDTPGMNAEAANKLFTLYLAAKRGDRVGYDKLNFGVPEDLIRANVAKIEANKEVSAVFEKARDQYNAYNRDLMRFMAQTGALTPEEAQRLAKTNDYIPYYREENGNAMLVIGGEGTFKVGSLAEQPQLRQLIGGKQKIMDFLTSSVENTSMLVDMGLRNIATKNAMFELESLGLAQFLGGTPSGPDIVSFKDKGVDKYVQVKTDDAGIPATLLVKGMEGIPVNNSAIVKAMGGMSTLLRRSITINPLYSARQVFRDSVAAPLLSGANFSPVFGALRQIGESATREKLESRGIIGGQIFTGTNEDLSRILGELQTGKMGMSQFIARAEAIAMEADALTRRAQYDSYIAQGLSEMEATMMSLEAMNFNRKGVSPSVRMASTLIPFFNAQLQSLDVLYRAVTGKMPMNERLDIQGKLLRRGALLAGTAVAYALLMQDDDTYKNATPDEKYGNFFIHIPGIKESLRVPVPFEVGYIFKSLPEAMVNIMNSKEGGEEALKAFKNIAIQTIPGGTSALMPAAAKPLLENLTGYSFFTGRQLETKAEQMEKPEFRFRDNTSEVAKQLGSAFGVSPIKVDNLIRGYTGSMGVALAQTFNFAMPTAGTPEQATKRLSDMPVVGPLFQPQDAGGIVGAVYDRMTEINEVKRTYDKLVKDGRRAEAQAFMQENAESYAKSGVTGNVQAQMSKITQAINAIKASSMTADEKRERLDALQDLRIRLATSVRGVL
jgi:hypothetical protein